MRGFLAWWWRNSRRDMCLTLGAFVFGLAGVALSTWQLVQ